jgi:DNA-binding response OmpR family regulator
VLLVDDDPLMRAICRVALEADGFVVDEAESVAEAFAEAERGAPDLVVLDRHLGTEDGWDVARRLKRRGRRARAAIILGFSAHRGQGDVDSALVAGCDAFLEKPCAPALLVSHVRGLLGLPLAPTEREGRRIA